ncbi:hypothetical protein Poli38472_002423 [Pythium oligandrum]|uniref:PH domain-containing protein n=1 Tax=Pythium oligandrum TaxID=41045 RepID=A0A8K1FL50_PYTOL|nr:hypothetical protein Poli38472_002423 [Pythium oligandrum]|eukprot:TMW63482.1 hypothetical protein Poli38472_002423 [Pythium oligandrum]
MERRAMNAAVEMNADVGVDDAVMGLAVNTRNYQAMLASSGIKKSSGSKANDENRREGENSTVVGIPVETRNYMALIDPKTRDSTNGSQQYRPSSGQASSNNNTVSETEDEDAVMGMPINTGNYLAMYRQDSDMKVRHRGYSDLAGNSGDRAHERPSAVGRRSTPEYSTASSSQSQQRETCFDPRRASGAVVPHSGWIYAQSPKMKAWKKYYAVLSGLDFRYSKEQGHSPKGFCTIQSVRRWDAKSHGVTVVCTSGKEMQFYCSSNTEREEWLTAANRSIEKSQHSSGNSKTTYVLTGGESHDGYLFMLEQRNRSWRRQYFELRNDGYLICKENENNSTIDKRASGYLKSVAFSPEVHPNGLVMQLDSGHSIFVYAETYDDRMLWYAAISAVVSANDRTPHRSTSVKSTYVQSARSNHSGWLFKQAGVFKAWKRMHFSLHGTEMGFAKDTNAPVEEYEKIYSIEEWDGKQHGLEIRLVSGKIWRVYAESYESAKAWRNLIGDAARQAEHFTIKRYLNSRRRKRLSPVFGGWFTTTSAIGVRLRRFYVMDGNMLGVADDVDHLLQPIGSVVDVGATRDTTNGMLIVFADGARLKVSGDSVESAKAWFECLNATL